MNDRIAELEAENKRLRRQLALHGIAQLPTVDLPTAAETKQLIALVMQTHSILRCGEGEDDERYRIEFRRAMSWLVFARRQPEPNEEYYFTFWLDYCREFLGRQGHAMNIVTLRPFVTAVVASGVTYLPLATYPHDLAFGLALGDANRPSSAWRDVLKNGAVPPPTASRRRVPTPSPPLFNVRELR